MNKPETKPPASWMRDALRKGFGYLNSGKFHEASEECRKVLTARPDIPEAHFLVGLVALELKNSVTAMRAFGSVTKLDPTHGAAWAQLARIFSRAGQPGRADAALKHAIEHEDGNPVVQDLVGLVLAQLGEQQEALAWYTKAASQEPSNVTFRVNRANCNMFLGKLEDAEEELRDVLAMQPGNPNAHWILAGLNKAQDRTHVEEMQKLIATGNYREQSLAFMNYGLGKELEDLEDWSAAFEAFAAGAKARRATIEFDEQAEVGMYDALQRVYTSDWLADGSRGCEDPSPIFVVGQPRTGTTLVERIITAHSDVHSAGELRQFGNAVRRLVDYRGATRFSAALMEQAASIDALELGETYIQTTRKLSGDAPRFVDKLPSNYLYVPLILKALPNAKIIHLRRNPMDACFSSFKQLFADAYPHSYDLREMARHHARYCRLMGTWRERFGDRLFEVAYEDVASNLEPHARALIEFLGLPWQDACLEFHKQTSAVTTASAVQVRKPAHTKSIGRWKRYEQQLGPLREELEAEGISVGDWS